MRNKSTDCKEFVHYADRLMRILAEEGFAVLPAVQPIDIETPCGTYHGLSGVDSSKIAAVSIVRAGDSLLQAVRDIEPGVQVGKILIQRDESDPLKRPKLIYVKLPRDIRNQTVILVDPMLATGGSAGKAIQVLKDRGVPEENILFLNVVACPEGIEYLTKAFPAITILTAEVDERLNEHKYIVPGLGDYGDRYFGTEE